MTQHTQRPFDLVLFGATGFTGSLTAEYLAAHAPPDAKWALAGRNQEKLKTLRDRLSEIAPSCSDLPLLHADLADTASLKSLAGQGRVVVTTVGPFLLGGEALVAACADAGTDYLDVTGEQGFIDQMYLRYDSRARRSGARLVHACGFISVVFDLGVLFTVQQLTPAAATASAVRIDAVLHTNLSALSKGSQASALALLARLPQTLAIARRRKQLEQQSVGRRVKVSSGSLRYDRATRSWAIPVPDLRGLMPLPDARAITRSATALTEYGKDFRYRRSIAVPRFSTAIAAGATVALLGVLSLFPPACRWMTARVDQQQAPSREQRSKMRFSFRLHGAAAGKKVTVEIAGGDPGYEESAVILAECALSLAFDDLPPTSGQTTPAIAMGCSLISRLRERLTFRVLSDDPLKFHR
ncbi:saccharopine dehydrogenase family protein [Streptomyces sp. NPDC003006]